MCRFEPLGYNK